MEKERKVNRRLQSTLHANCCLELSYRRFERVEGLIREYYDEHKTSMTQKELYYLQETLYYCSRRDVEKVSQYLEMYKNAFVTPNKFQGMEIYR